MRQRNRWSANVSAAMLLIGLGIVFSHVQVAQAVTTISKIGEDIDGEATGDGSGYSVAMSADGTRIVIGAPWNDGSAAGHVRVYTLTNGTWTQTGSDINGRASGDYFGRSVAMSADGTRIAIGAPNNDTGGSNAGQVRIFTWSGSEWTQTGSDINGEASGKSGYSVAMSADGTHIAIGAAEFRAPIFNGSLSIFGQVRIYTLTNGTWAQTGDASGEHFDYLGWSVAMSADGTRIVTGAPFNDGRGRNAGRVRVYSITNGTWTQTGENIDGEAADDQSGYSVAMSADGTRIAIGAPYNGSADAGHVRVYTLTNGAWTKIGEDIDGEAAEDESGTSVAMSADGTRIAIGAWGSDGWGSNAGHVRIYTWNGSAWTKIG